MLRAPRRPSRSVYRHPGTDAVQGAIPTTPVITFDAGQTLVELDLDFLSRRLSERGLEVAPRALVDAAPAAWRHYDAQVAAGRGHPWQDLMAALLEGAGLSGVDSTVAWLWSEQPRVNLFRKPVAEMVELARELVRAGARLAVLSNSEGRLAELLEEISIADPFTVIVDSGRLGFEKPDRRIFEHTLAELGIENADPIHIGDSWAADIVGARDAGWRSIWYGRTVQPTGDPRIASAVDPAAVRAALVEFGVL